MACSSSSGPGPSAFRQSPSARADAGTQARAHGTMARSPASAITASRTSASGIRVISTMTLIMNALVSSRSRSPFTYFPRQHGPLRDPVDHARAGLPLQPVLQRAERRVAGRAALRLDPPVPPDPRRRDRHDLAEHRHLARAGSAPSPRRPAPTGRRPRAAGRSAAATPRPPAGPPPSARRPEPPRHPGH